MAAGREGARVEVEVAEIERAGFLALRVTGGRAGRAVGPTFSDRCAPVRPINAISTATAPAH